MTGQRIGYIRVSTFDQNPERQLDSIKVDRIFTDKASGKDIKRPELESLLSFTRIFFNFRLLYIWASTFHHNNNSFTRGCPFLVPFPYDIASL